MQFEIVAVGSMKTAGLGEALEEYLDRIDRYVSVEMQEVKAASAGDPEARMRAEAESLASAAPEAGTWVALDGRGRSIRSEKFAGWIDDQMIGGVRYVSFFLGGAHGLDDEFREETCDWSLSLSSLTLPHELARVVLAEQLYRAMTIVRGEPYHK